MQRAEGGAIRDGVLPGRVGLALRLTGVASAGAAQDQSGIEQKALGRQLLFGIDAFEQALRGLLADLRGGLDDGGQGRIEVGPRAGCRRSR